MTLAAPDAVTIAVSARHTPWATPLTRPEMSNEAGSKARIRVNSRHLERDGRPFIPVSGEMHYSRVPRERWLDRLRLMRSGGLTAVAAYVPWIHHEEREGETCFSGNRDIRAFIDTAADAGLDVVLRIGPWVHAEVRNGGFPDWVQEAPVIHRTDDPGYLSLVEGWFARLGAEVGDLMGAPGPVIGIQVENELYDQPAHIATLKSLAKAHGLVAPIWTATGWGSAELPGDEVFPLYGGYPDGFWVAPEAGWAEAFREQFFFTHLWDDPHIGADLRWHFGGPQILGGRRSPSTTFPPATCELGGGMTGAYHRRPKVSGRDVAAVGLAKIGSGSAWQGFYMYVGGLNPRGRTGLQESHASGYPNDMPTFDYDFHAPISTTGRVRESHALLRRQHAFLAAFGERLATMPSTLPHERPSSLGDTTTLRWALRSDGETGFVFINAHQPYEPLDPPIVRFALELDAATVEFPAAPIAIPPGTLAHWPVNLPFAGATIAWATASVLTTLEGEVPILVLAAEEGVPVEIAFGAEPHVEPATEHADVDGHTIAIDASQSRSVRVRADDAVLDIVVLSPQDAAKSWVFETPWRQLVLADGAIWADDDGSLSGRSTTAADSVRRYDAVAQAFLDVAIELVNDAIDVTLVPEQLRPAREIPAEGYGRFRGQVWSAPDAEQRAELAERLRVTLPPEADTLDAELEVAWEGDVLQLTVDGVVVYDQFWTGHDFVVNLRDVGATSESDLVLELMPLHPDAPVRVSADAQQVRDGGAGAPVGAVRSIRLVEPARWRERSPVQEQPPQNH
jgi:beta-galactosidase